ncbi:DUF4436 domain-containing protein [Mycobacterium sp. CBMA 234]|uniref:DUF4436 domain-containing protein n=1 Tax=Mycolicibacterium sp. CBMA 234 TaxID=1918495 RepID=UPI0012DDF844|nr:DUF4436 domain-containing protein [Mycolicibacterium sp. CBMA 234]MUL62922.1 DUF4436 domain-containing protein [Mycolicibacterium sp. CBMA 234]
MRVRIIAGLAIVVAVYVTTIALYASTGLGRPSRVSAPKPTADGTTVTIDLNEVHAVKGDMVANVSVVPGSELLDPMTHALTDDLSVAVQSAVTPTRRTWSKGMVPDVFPVALILSGDQGNYPFDHYQSGPITVELFRGGSHVPIRVAPAFYDRVAGWMFHIPTDRNSAHGIYRVNTRRSPSTAAFAAVIVGALVTIAVLGAVVAIQTARNRRRFQPPMTTWFAALLFAVVPLRNALPDAPPIGTWIDVSIVLWVIVTLVASMSLYITLWWRHLAPEPHQKA